MNVLEPRVRRWTKAEYHQMGALGWFEGQRVELVEGEIVVMSPQKPPHFAAIDRAAEVLRRSFGPLFWVRAQGPIDLGIDSEPEPDVSVVSGRREDYREHPRTAVLLVEVSDTSLAYDRHRKGGLYSKGGIAEYWILNLVDRALEVYRDPIADAASPAGYRYASMASLQKGDLVTPLALPAARIAVDDLLG